MTEKYFAILMIKKTIDTDIYSFKPTKLIEGNFKTTEDGKVFADQFGIEYELIEDPEFVLNDSESGVGYVISEKGLLETYENVDIKEAYVRYFDEMCSKSHMGLYIEESDSVVITTLDFTDIVDELNRFDENELAQSQVGLQLSIEKIVEGTQEPVNLVHLQLNYFDFFSLFEAENINEIKKILEGILSPMLYEEVKKRYKETSKEENKECSIYNEVAAIKDTTGIEVDIDYETFFSLYEAKESKEALNILKKICPPEVLKSIKIDSLPINSGKDILNLYNDYNELFENTKELAELKIYLRNFAIILKNLTVVFEEMDHFPKVQETKNVFLEIASRCKSLRNKDSLEEIIVPLTKTMTVSKCAFVGIAAILDTLKIKDLGLVAEDSSVTEKELSTPKQEEEKVSLPNVPKMKSYLDQFVIGQEAAKKAIISTLIMNTLTEDAKTKNVCMLIEPTGSGKTLLAETIASYYGVPFYIVDTTQLTSPGYVGSNIEDILKYLLEKAGDNQITAERGILVLNEIDKKGSERNEDIAGKGVLNTFLPLIEGTTYHFEYKNKQIAFHTKDLTFFATGSFENVWKQKRRTNAYKSTTMGFLTEEQRRISKKEKLEIKEEDLIEYGLMPAELIGRISNIIQLEEHTRESLKKVLTESSISPLLAEQKKLSKINISLVWDEGYLEAVVEEALKKKKGGRALKKIIEESIMDGRWEALYYLGFYKEIRLSKNTVMNPLDCELVTSEGKVYNLQELINPNEDILSRNIAKTQNG